jgi:PadR family transcriptional regulator PadR
MTGQTLRLLEAFLMDLSRDWYGLDLMAQTGLKSGTIYPLLHRLQADGWLSSAKERINPRHEGRPARRFYRLTGLGQREARAALADRAKTSQPATARIPRLHPGGVTI